MFDESIPGEEPKQNIDCVNPFRKFKEKDSIQQQVASNLDVKRVKYNK